VVTVARCEHCGNEYDKAFTITTADGGSHTFDAFECAIAAVAPTCAHCGCRIIGHGVESGGAMYCCAHCASEMGEHGLRDRANASHASSRSPTPDDAHAGIAPTRPPGDE
jgi:hypothetical protein